MERISPKTGFFCKNKHSVNPILGLNLDRLWWLSGHHGYLKIEMSWVQSLLLYVVAHFNDKLLFKFVLWYTKKLIEWRRKLAVDAYLRKL